MPAKRLDFSDFEERNTLLLTVPTYVDGKPTGEKSRVEDTSSKLRDGDAVSELCQAKQMRELNEIMQKAKAKKEEGQEEVDLTVCARRRRGSQARCGLWAACCGLVRQRTLARRRAAQDELSWITS